MYNIKSDLQIRFIGDEIKFLSNVDRKSYIYSLHLSSSNEIDINVTNNINIEFSSKHVSQTIHDLTFNLILNSQSTVHFVDQTWDIPNVKISINQHNHTKYIIDSEVFPFDISCTRYMQTNFSILKPTITFSGQMNTICDYRFDCKQPNTKVIFKSISMDTGDSVFTLTNGKAIFYDTYMVRTSIIFDCPKVTIYKLNSIYSAFYGNIINGGDKSTWIVHVAQAKLYHFKAVEMNNVNIDINYGGDIATLERGDPIRVIQTNKTSSIKYNFKYLPAMINGSAVRYAQIEEYGNMINHIIKPMKLSRKVDNTKFCVVSSDLPTTDINISQYKDICPQNTEILTSFDMKNNPDSLLGFENNMITIYLVPNDKSDVFYFNNFTKCSKRINILPAKKSTQELCTISIDDDDTFSSITIRNCKIIIPNVLHVNEIGLDYCNCNLVDHIRAQKLTVNSYFYLKINSAQIESAKIKVTANKLTFTSSYIETDTFQAFISTNNNLELILNSNCELNLQGEAIAYTVLSASSSERKVSFVKGSELLISKVDVKSTFVANVATNIAQTVNAYGKIIVNQGQNFEQKEIIFYEGGRINSSSTIKAETVGINTHASILVNPDSYLESKTMKFMTVLLYNHSNLKSKELNVLKGSYADIASIYDLESIIFDITPNSVPFLNIQQKIESNSTISIDIHYDDSNLSTYNTGTDPFVKFFCFPSKYKNQIKLNLSTKKVFAKFVDNNDQTCAQLISNTKQKQLIKALIILFSVVGLIIIVLIVVLVLMKRRVFKKDDPSMFQSILTDEAGNTGSSMQY
ncbi:hypothetical protein TVAG_485250 [Trichomonas vaginalis G3]|uniref:Uncharacterized protein n=1 Tax=Trichomonas vaginalis (strain ATCC PRA-98 / G3) TaxID=412133 RepID=A2EZ41_TRIV3|nr:hypothetical protein TVAGG3_0754360 [Trichomonas vaginalis G3]EAY02090.1 hypothetical protein TVAG_485250 [Trichomonas vaginalis G3]KAI5512760.1 hypothetical protein TVAGG3_0754360 [Trichomonas vaginalis G3]|eukprot:XP_001330845.1 hypothetical protein [Trichomonas vaginalis G3]